MASEVLARRWRRDTGAPRDYPTGVLEPLTDEMIADARAHFRRRGAVRREALEALRQELMEGAKRAAACLAAEPGVTSVVLFGSVALGTADSHSDIDLAVAGLPAELYFRASADIVDAAGVEVDLVRLEEAEASLLARIEADGVVRYDAG